MFESFFCKLKYCYNCDKEGLGGGDIYILSLYGLVVASSLNRALGHRHLAFGPGIERLNKSFFKA